ncbi:MAG: hypothetical protein HS116_11940 [Planctomycetes bacterium]|nr:hypothetical protein [Planctomycetota bacterium]
MRNRMLTVLCLCLGLSGSAWCAELDPQELVRQLGSDSFESRERAEKELLRQGRTALGELRTAAKSDQPEVAVRARRLLAQIDPPLVLEVEVAGEARAGQPAKLKVSLLNTGDRTVTVVPCLDGSTRAKRFPHFARTIVAPTPAGPEAVRAGCGYCNALSAADLVELKPGERFDPLTHERSFGSDLAEWTPSEAGTHKITFSIRYDAPSVEGWRPPAAREGGAEDWTQRLGHVPALRLEKTLTVQVAPAAPGEANAAAPAPKSTAPVSQPPAPRSTAPAPQRP